METLSVSEAFEALKGGKSLMMVRTRAVRAALEDAFKELQVHIDNPERSPDGFYVYTISKKKRSTAPMPTPGMLPG